MSKKPRITTSAEKPNKGFAILENALRISLIIIKIAIVVIVPKGGHIYDPGVIF